MKTKGMTILQIEDSSERKAINIVDLLSCATVGVRGAMGSEVEMHVVGTEVAYSQRDASFVHDENIGLVAQPLREVRITLVAFIDNQGNVIE